MNLHQTVRWVFDSASDAQKTRRFLGNEASLLMPVPVLLIVQVFKDMVSAAVVVSVRMFLTYD